jgi:pimeloyl-ACP methyl ester carboxylesterase
MGKYYKNFRFNLFSIIIAKFFSKKRISILNQSSHVIMQKKFLVFVFIFICSIKFNYAQSKAKINIKSIPANPLYVIVHGAWGGSWAFKKTDSLLTKKGCRVYRPSLTGLGERVHLATLETGLKTHITDVVNAILYEDLHNVILVGHSYGGMVITGVADSIPDRIQKIIYLDAFVPKNGESVKDLRASHWDWFEKMNRNGFLYPEWLKPGQIPGDVPHPMKTLTDPIALKNSKAAKLPAVYILTVDKGKKAEDDDFASQAQRAREKSWPVVILESDHNPQWSATEKLVEMLYQNK